MFAYYLKLAWLSARKTWGLTLLMVLAIALGIGASMTTITVNYLMSANPIPHKSEQLFYVELDAWDPQNYYSANQQPPLFLTYRDASALWQAGKAQRQTLMSATSAVIEPVLADGRHGLPFMATGRATSADFFPMFDVPFLYGSGWDHNTDLKKELVVVINKELNERLFGGRDSTGQTLRLAGKDFRIIGVLAQWQPTPRFYDPTGRGFEPIEDFYLPFALVVDQVVSRAGPYMCWQPTASGFQAFLDSECVWAQLWVELPSAADVEQYQSFIAAYTEQQHQLGRFGRTDNNQLLDVMALLEQLQVVYEDAGVLLLLSLLFLLVCLLNTVGLLLAKFTAKAGEIGIRQALGASRRDLFIQHLIEAGCIGLAGGLLGLLFSWLGLMAVRDMYGSWMQHLAVLNWQMVVLAFVLALLSSLLAGLYPTWRACQVQPSQQLKVQ